MIEKAGGIILRTQPDGTRALYGIHRPRYNDWSLPKGHIDEGEDTEAAALREVREETGLHCRITAPLPPLTYTLPDGRQARVHYYMMDVETVGEPEDDEADRGEWIPLSEIATKLTYPNVVAYIQEHL